MIGRMSKKRKVSPYDPPVRCRERRCNSLLDLVHMSDYKWKVSCPKCRRYEGRTFEDEPYNHEHYVGG
jgi:phage FluMu protein Com